MGGSDREPGTLQAETQVSEELGSQLSDWVSILLWRWGQGSVAGGPQWAVIQVSTVPRLELLSYCQRECSQGRLPLSRCPSLQRVMAVTLIPGPSDPAAHTLRLSQVRGSCGKGPL